MSRDWSPWGLALRSELWDISALKLKYFDKTIFCYWQLAWLQRKIFRNSSEISNLIMNLRWEGEGRRVEGGGTRTTISSLLHKKSGKFWSYGVKRSGDSRVAEWLQSRLFFEWRGEERNIFLLVTLSQYSTELNIYNHVAAILLLTREKSFQSPGNEV